MKLFVIILLIFLSGCYSQKRAAKQFGKAVVTYPKIGADYCADVFPVAEIFIPGDSVIVYDTVQGEGITITETITVKDTVMITVTLPGKIVTKIIHIVDTVYKENTAAVKACEIVRDQALQIATDKTAEATSWKKKAKNRFWVLTGIAGLSLLLAGLWVRRKAKGK